MPSGLKRFQRAEALHFIDGEGRICAVRHEAVAGFPTMMQYIYDAGGNRVAKGTITNWSAGCDTTQNGFTPQTVFVLGPSGEQLTEMNKVAGSWQWQHTNVTAGSLSATYTNDNVASPAGSVYFHLSDWLGTRRQQTDYAGNPVEAFSSLPYGDEFDSEVDASAPGGVNDATEHHFTGKERDTESGNDYFGARYYASSMGRFMSPDWSAKVTPVPYAKLDDPQSLNLYAYVRNNPLSLTDPSGHGWWGDYWQKVGNNLKYGEFVTNAKLPAAFASERSWLIKNAAANQSAVTALQGASNGQINQIFNGYRGQIAFAVGNYSNALATDPRNYSLVGGAVLYRGGDFSNIDRGQYRLDADGNVRGGADPGARGPSLFDDPAKIPPRFTEINPVTEEMLGPNLKAIPWGKAGHFEVVPVESGVPPQTFLGWLGQILGRAEPVE